jgi:hypothetical protein
MFLYHSDLVDVIVSKVELGVAVSWLLFAIFKNYLKKFNKIITHAD